MKLNNEWDFLLNLKKMLENWYWNDGNMEAKQNLNIITNLKTINLNAIENIMFMNKHYGDFYENTFIDIFSDDKNILYTLKFEYKYSITRKKYLFFFKRKVIDDFRLETTIDGVFYNRKNYKNLEYKNFLELKDEIFRIETLMKYLENYYLSKKY
jgi:hypothetical protein